MTGDPAWKKTERRVAVYLGGRRNPTSGGNGAHSRSDALLPIPLYVETKHGLQAERLLRSRPRLVRLFNETEERASAEGKVPVVVLHPPRWGNGGVGNYPAYLRVALAPGEGTIGCVPLSAVRAVAPRLVLLPHSPVATTTGNEAE